MTDSYTWQYLVERYLAGTCSREELEAFLQKAAEENEPASLDAVLQRYWEEMAAAGGPVDAARNARWDEQFDAMMKAARQRAIPAIRQVVDLQAGIQRPRPRRYWVAAAALVLLLGSAGYWLYSGRPARQQTIARHPASRYENDLPPGSTGAVLTLSGGRRIVLDSAGKGLLAVQGKTRLINGNGRVVYESKSEASPAAAVTAAAENILTTPKGRQYQLVLPDGTGVWLNAASSIRYPTAFSGNSREVEITGEVYLEVAPDARRPFVLHANGLTVDVLGTSLDVKAYPEEEMIETTVLSGAVRVSGNTGGGGKVLRPGQQARANSGGDILMTETVDVDQVTSWKDGYFAFNNTDLAAVMREISRWYDVDIVYEGRIPDRKFGGEISRNSNASQVLKILEESKVYFRIEGKKIIVLP